MRVLFGLIVTVAVSSAFKLNRHGGFAESRHPRLSRRQDEASLVAAQIAAMGGGAQTHFLGGLKRNEDNHQRQVAEQPPQNDADTEAAMIAALVGGAQTHEENHQEEVAAQPPQNDADPLAAELAAMAGGQLTEEQKLQVEEKQTSVDVLSNQLSGERQKSSNLLSTLEAVRDELAAVTNEKNIIVQDRDEMNSKNIQLLARIADLNNEVSRLEAEVQSHEDRINSKDQQHQEEVLIIQQLFQEEKEREKEELEQHLHQKGWSVIGEDEDESFEEVEVEEEVEESEEGSGDDGSGEEESGESSGDGEEEEEEESEESGDGAEDRRRRGLKGFFNEGLSIGRRSVQKKRSLLLRGDKINEIE